MLSSLARDQAHTLNPPRDPAASGETDVHYDSSNASYVPRWPRNTLTIGAATPVIVSMLAGHAIVIQPLDGDARMAPQPVRRKEIFSESARLLCPF
ncbi:hypothetical protein E2C01_052474 [Portunus trituberculatus]|uniref:Uncharacterized protein n=1 Tax=Portunus trituberculatus TaxID=210409 RepID=A0A5B7GLN6_PORTR|nr:hypothetical protein [Portunus trituberculatus]